MNVIIRKKSVHICSTYVFLVQVEHLDIRIIFKNHTGNNLIPNL